MSVQSLLIGHLQKTRALTQAVFAGIEDQAWITQPQGLPNHPLWQLGHLAYVMQALGKLANPDAAAVDACIAEGFGKGSLPHQDEDNYPPVDEVIKSFDTGFDHLIAWVESLDDQALTAPRDFGNPLFGQSIAELLLFLTLHESIHAGQVTSWRRAIDMPSWLAPPQAK